MDNPEATQNQDPNPDLNPDNGGNGSDQDPNMFRDNGYNDPNVIAVDDAGDGGQPPAQSDVTKIVAEQMSKHLTPFVDLVGKLADKINEMSSQFGQQPGNSQPTAERVTWEDVQAAFDNNDEDRFAKMQAMVDQTATEKASQLVGSNSYAQSLEAGMKARQFAPEDKAAVTKMLQSNRTISSDETLDLYQLRKLGGIEGVRKAERERLTAEIKRGNVPTRASGASQGDNDLRPPRFGTISSQSAQKVFGKKD
jgi:hypothetical protein